MGRRPFVPRRRATRAAAAVCVAVGVWLLADAALVRGRSFVWQEINASRFGRLAPAGVLESPLPSGPWAGHGSSAATRVGSALASGRAFKRGEAVARLRVPRLGLDSLVAEGTDRATLALGPGHLEGSALPGGRDNCIIAGHRDGAFARLRTVRPGDTVEVTGADGTHRYRVLDVRVVPKEDNSVLRPSPRPLLTLITCYPFEHVGPAPKRLVVIGELLDDGGPA
jgi:sortase A